MKIQDNGVIRDMTPQEIADLEKAQAEYEAHKYDGMSYADIVVSLIREKYSLNDELALHRQRDSKSNEFDEYNTYCEECKIKARNIEEVTADE